MRVLRSGSRGPAVQFLQLALNRAGYGALETDGVFGSLTEAALRRFQGAQGLAADGVAGTQTHRKLMPWYTGFRVQTVMAGDTLWRAAQQNGVSVEALLLANPGVRPENLRIGSELVVPLPFSVVPTDIDWCSAVTACCVRRLAARYPFLHAGEIGRSVMGKPLWSLCLGSGENRVLYSAAHHANEWITTPLLLRFAEALAAAFAAGEKLAGYAAGEILDYATLSLIPAVDPDGIDLVTGELQQGDYYEAARRIAASRPELPFPRGWKANIRGVDLNLQYPAGWEQAREIKFAQGVRGPAPADYVGAAPLSAPESRALYEYTRRFSPDLVLAYHSQGRVIYWKYQNVEVPGAQRIAELFAAASGYAAEDTPYASGFAGYKDWFIRDFRRPGFTVEVGRGVNPLPIGDLEQIWRENLGILTLGALVT